MALFKPFGQSTNYDANYSSRSYSYFGCVSILGGTGVEWLCCCLTPSAVLCTTELDNLRVQNESVYS